MITHDPLWVWSFHRIHSKLEVLQSKVTSSTPPINAWLPSLQKRLIVVGMASSFAKNENDLRRFPLPENVRLVTGYNTKMAELGNVFGTSIFCSETFYRCKRNEIFMRSGIESYGQWLRGSFISIAQRLELKKLISQSDMPRILLSNGHRKICSVCVEMSVSRSRMVVRKWNLE